MVLASLFALLGGAAHAGAIASHFKPETRLGANYWNAASALDGKPETCWMVPGESANRGESITIDVPKGEVDKLGMVIGWAKDDDTWKDYPRIKEVQVEVLSYNDARELYPVGKANATFEDKPGMQVVDLTDLKVGTDEAGGKVKITIVDLYPGQDFPNFGISEILVHLKEFADPSPVQVGEVSGADSGHAQENMVDKNPKTFWSAPAEGAQFTINTAGFGLSRVGLTPASKDYARPKKVKISVGNRSSTVELPDGTGVQWIEVPAMNGYTGSAWGEVTVEFLEVYPGAKNGSIGIAEMTAYATTFEGL